MLKHTPADRPDVTLVALNCSDPGSFKARVIVLWNAGANTADIAAWLGESEPDVYRALVWYLNKKHSTGWCSKHDASQASIVRLRTE